MSVSRAMQQTYVWNVIIYVWNVIIYVFICNGCIHWNIKIFIKCFCVQYYDILDVHTKFEHECEQNSHTPLVSFVLTTALSKQFTTDTQVNLKHSVCTKMTKVCPCSVLIDHVIKFFWNITLIFHFQHIQRDRYSITQFEVKIIHVLPKKNKIKVNTQIYLMTNDRLTSPFIYFS